ncbi:MAG TPA: collagen-like protein, partial [Actinomycetota bacterium]|nr:collagen-like protein [Actinomycetota bacterium]
MAKSPEQKGPKLRPFRGSSLAQAIQGNFDHLMGALRNLTRSHNVLVDDVTSLADTVDEVIEAGGSHHHDGAGSEAITHDDLTGVDANQHHDREHNILSSAHSDTDDTDTPSVGDVLTWSGTQWIADTNDPEANGRSPRRGSRPPALYYDQDEFMVWMPPSGAKGDTGPAGADGAQGADGTIGVDGKPGPPGFAEDGE